MARSQQTAPETKDAKAEATEAKESTTLLVSPDGKKEWEPANAVERVNLQARGWKPKA